MGVSRSRDDYRLGKPIIHAAISPFPLLLYGCSALSIIFLVSLSLSLSFSFPCFFLFPFFDASLSIHLDSFFFFFFYYLCTFHGVWFGTILARRRIVTCIFYGRTVPLPSLRLRLRKEKFLHRRKRKRKKDCGPTPGTRTLSPKLDTIEN